MAPKENLNRALRKLPLAWRLQSFLCSAARGLNKENTMNSTTTAAGWLDHSLWRGRIFNGGWQSAKGGAIVVKEPATG
jgi:hypothetical protein